ncbi:hypothetical protein HFO21_25995 [Rhizobium laguerreae]|nr:hypothetical protein [Rhizobium laguerreae]MBY3217766.1 hypothetical protein [Rhizobium laguerreae]
MHQLSELTFNSDQAFGTLTTRLLRSGLIDRQQGLGRVIVHTLTEKGKMLLQQGQARHHRVMEGHFAGLSDDERDLLGTLLNKLGGYLTTSHDHRLGLRPIDFGE